MMPSAKNAHSLLRSATCAGALALLFGAAVAQTPTVVPLPFVTAIAGVPAGSTNAQCSVDIPNNAGAHLGDGCLPTQANLVTLYGAFTDSIGNIYITENGTNNDIRVIYEGGAVLTQMLIASSPAITGFAPIPGHIYTLAGARASTLTKSRHQIHLRQHGHRPGRARQRRRWLPRHAGLHQATRHVGRCQRKRLLRFDWRRQCR